jgi:hypothetical protein
MRKFSGILGVVIFILGVIGVFGVRLLVDRQFEGGTIVFWGSLVLVLAGWVISSTARNKTCSHCQARVEAEAGRCERCGMMAA